MGQSDPPQIFLLRHAMPLASADVVAAQWPLSDAGRRAAIEVGDRVPSGARLASSAEQKAIQTLTLATGVEQSELMIDPRFGEVIRPGEPFDDDVIERRRAWVEGRPDERHRGWETPAEAAARFDAGVAGVVSAGADRMLIASHGMIITAWLVARGVIPGGRAAGDFWAGLGFGELIDVGQMMIRAR